VEAQTMLESLGQATDVKVESDTPEFASDTDIDAASLLRESQNGPIIRLVNWVFFEAVRRKASDIHIEPYESEMRVRFRVDGRMHTVLRPSLTWRDAV